MPGKERSNRCAWCGRRFAVRPGPGRPRRFCRQVCRQRDYEARKWSRELGLTEAELVIARHELDELYDRLYELECAVDDVNRDLSKSATKRDYEEALAWVLAAARPLLTTRLGEAVT